MNKEMIISSGAHDTRVAILEDDQVVEIFIERENQRGVVGNIYKGRCLLYTSPSPRDS